MVQALREGNDKMQNDRKITITTAGNHKSTSWLPQGLTWGELVEKLRTPVRSTETLEQFLAYPKARQDELKDVGGFVAGSFKGTRRKADAVAGRDVITLDLDNIPQQGAEGALRAVDGLGCAYAVYSTRKHSPLAPRLRVLLPLSRTVTADEYEPLARRMGEYIGLTLCDPTTFEASRLMYWPSVSANSQYVFTFADRGMLDVDGLLRTYADWRNFAEWPVVPGTAQAQQRLIDKQGDPTGKPGVVGAFCRVYNVYGAIAKFIPNAYTPCDTDDRFTYTGGSTTGGAVIYDDGNFLYSHHATDPCGNRLVNAFDLVRLHLFAGKDDEAKPGTPFNRLPSFVAMCEKATADPDVAALMNRERYDAAVKEFADAPVQATENAPENWMPLLKTSPQTGDIAKTVDNVIIILEHDPLLKGRIIYDEFSNRALTIGPLPWDDREGRREWTDLDDSGIRHYVERVFGITGEKKLLDAVALVGFKHRVNYVKAYLQGLKWDDTPRLDRLLVDYLGAEDTEYTRTVTRKALVAAVARALRPGCKFDNMLILAGPQGIGKSTLFRKLGREWFSDSLKTFEGKEASELIQGIWINEIGELEAMARSEISLVKQFLSQTDDIFRQAYGRRTERFPRRCVFFGTSNGTEFLRDKTGNRRFWPVDTAKQAPTKSVFRDLTEDEVGQIWAEALVRLKIGEPLFLAGSVEQEAAAAQEEHRERSAKEGPILEFIEKQVPEDWDRWTLDQRRAYWSGAVKNDEIVLVPRTKICALEVWCELFNGDMKQMKYPDAVEINGAIDQAPGWLKIKKSIRFGYCGKQRGRIKDSPRLLEQPL